MQEQLQSLVKLQEIDKTLYDFEQELESFPPRLAELGHTAAELESSLTETQKILGEVTGRRQELEKANEGIRARVRRAENRLMGAKNQKEYRAATAEIEEGKDAIRSNDDALLEVMEKQEELNGRAKSLEDEFKAASSEAGAQRKLLTKRASQLQAEIDRLKGKRGALVADVEAELLKQYDFIRKNRLGVALAAVKDGTCMVCHMQLPPQQFNELQRMDRIMTCPSCRRLIYWDNANAMPRASPHFHED